MVVGEASIHNIMGGMESTGGVRLHHHKRKLKQRFDIIKKLGQGTYGKVQLGINKETGQEVAIKTIKKCKIKTEADLIRIRREIQIMSSVQHPNIIHIYEVFENKEKMVLVMEYAAGGELYDYLSERKVLSEQEARRIFRQISIAVFYCHKHKICHRDLKLENILLDQIGNAKIADFGLSNVFDEQRLLNTFCGSPLYASPEIVKGTPYHGPEVDCWSLGVLLYTLVYGAMPFDGSNFKRLTRQISQSDYFEPKNPSPASPLIKDMLTKCPARRADIEKICLHWWVNEGYDYNCLEIAEDLAAETPVRLDLLLSLVPQSASADKLVVGDQSPAGEIVNSMSSETLAPTRCHSVGSLMELDRNNSDRRVREMIEEEPRGSAIGESKRKLENTPSMDEAAGLEAGAKRKERLRKKDKNDETRPHRFTSNRHHSAPIAHPITEEAMEIDPGIIDNVTRTGRRKPLLDLRNDETASACLELIKESLSKSPSKERSKTPVAISDKVSTIDREFVADVNENVNDAKPISDKLAGVEEKKSSEPDEEIQRVADESTKRARDSSEIIPYEETSSEEKVVNAASKLAPKEAIQESVKIENDKVSVSRDSEPAESTSTKDSRKLKQKALSLDCDNAASSGNLTERRRSKIFETAEKFNQLAAGIESEKPKKIFIPGVNVGGAKRAFERKASLSSIVAPQAVKQSTSKVIIDVPNERKNAKIEEKSNIAMKTSQEIRDDVMKREEEKKRAVDIITGAIGKPPVQKKINGSPPVTPQSPESKKLGLKIQVGPNDVRSATVSVSTPIDTKFPFETKPVPYELSIPNSPESQSLDSSSYADEPTLSSKMEITLKSATLPRQRKTSKAEITLTGIKPPEIGAFKSKVEAKIDAFHPQKLRTQRSEVAFPVAAAVPHANRSSSLEPEGGVKILPKERIIPIQVETDHQKQGKTSNPPPKPPMPQRSMSQRSGSLSRQSTADSDTDSALGCSTIGPEPIRKSPREYIIPIAVEGGGYVTPRSGSAEPESKNSTPTGTNPSRSRFGRPRRMSSLLSDASEDESPFSTLHRDSDDLLQRHMHRLRSSRPTRQPPEHADSLSSGEDDDDDGFELLTAENLFSTLLSRVRSLTQRLNVDDSRASGFPSSRLLGRLGSNSSQGFWGLHEPLSRRLSESPFRRSMSRDTDRFGKRDSAVPSNSGTPSSPGARSTPSRESIFEMGSSNTLPRDKKAREDDDADATDKLIKSTRDKLEHNFTPSLARRLSRQFIEQTRQSLPRSPSIPREKLYRSSTDEKTVEREKRSYGSTISDQTEYRSRSCDRSVRRANGLSANNERYERFEPRSPRRSVSLFDDEDNDDDDDDDNNKNNNNNNNKNDDDDDESSSSLMTNLTPRQVMTHGRKYRDATKSSLANFHNYRTEKIQEEPHDEIASTQKYSTNVDQDSLTGCNESSTNNYGVNIVDGGSSHSAISCDASATESFSIRGDCCASRQNSTRDFESRLLAAENLIKESKARNLGGERYERNLTSSYRDIEKCDEKSLARMSETFGDATKRRSFIPSLRLRSGSLTREATNSNERRNTVSCTKDISDSAVTMERSLLSKFFRGGSSNGSVKSDESRDTREKSPKPRVPRRISRFLRPDFFDTPREESQYVKDKEARRAADNERRKSRFTKKKLDTKMLTYGDEIDKVEMADGNEKPEKELKNEANAMTRDKTEILPNNMKINDESTNLGAVETRNERQATKNSFFQSLEKKLEKFRSSDESAKFSNVNGTTNNAQRDRTLRETSAPPIVTIVDSPEMPECSPASVENSCLDEPTACTSKSRVSTVLGLFKNDPGKLNSNGQRSQSTILSKFKRNAYKGSRSDGARSIDQIPSTSNSTSSSSSSSSSSSGGGSSKIPTKFAKIDAKSKKIVDGKESPEKLVDMKKSLSKEKSPADRSGSGKSLDKQTKIMKKTSAEKSSEVKSEKMEKLQKNGSPEKSSDDKTSLAKLSARKLSADKMTDNRQIEAKSNNDNEDKKIVVKAKKNVRSLASLVKNGSIAKLETREEAAEKRAKKIVKSKDSSDRDTSDGTKKKKIVRVARKVGKNSDSSDSKSEEKESTRKTLMKKITSGGRKDACAENAAGKIEEKSPEIVVKKIDEKRSASPSSLRDKSPLNRSSAKEKSPERKVSAITKIMKIMDEKSSIIIPDDSLATASRSADCNSSKIREKSSSEISARSSDSTIPKPTESKSNGSPEKKIQNTDSRSKDCLPGLGIAKFNRTNLKLDLTKIPQHSFKNGAISKKDSTIAESSGSKLIANITKIVGPVEIPKSEKSDDKLMENPSKMTRRANKTKKKITIDEASGARDFENLQREIVSPEIPKNREISCSPRKMKNIQLTEETSAYNAGVIEKLSNSSTRPTTLQLESKNSNSPRPARDTPNEHSEDIFSPLDDPESFDSWSICSADLNHHRHDINSPTSPTYSPISRGDHTESIIDRIRRKSFYSRFNERKRKSSLNVPPPGVTLPVSSTLPRKFSFNCSRDRHDYGKPNIYGGSTRRNPERSYSLYNDDTTLSRYGKSSMERDRHYSESIGNVASFADDPKSMNDQYGSLGSCYDSLRRYRISPSPETLAHHRKYQSTDYGLDNDIGSYRSPMSPSFHDDPRNVETYTSRGTLGRKYGSVSSCPETKTADYYEELLSPSRSDYLTSRKTPIPNDCNARHENGYHNGNTETHRTDNEKWKNYSEKIASLDLTDGSDGRLLDKQTRSNAEKDNESQDLPASSTEPDDITSKTE